MIQPVDNATTTLAGLAAANGPWLSMRLARLAELADLPLARELIERAVAGASKVLAEVLNAEGHLALNAGPADPVVLLGREQAEVHQQTGLSMPSSLKVQRLLRRAYDDLVRESWVDRDSRARAHEDVEHFFERALAGLVSAWTGHAAVPQDSDLAGLVARREDELRRALAAAKKITLLMHQARAGTEAAAVELARVREGEAASIRERGRLNAEVQGLGARIRELEEERAALGDRLADLEMTLAAHGDAERARIDAEKELARVRAEAEAEREKAERVRVEVARLEQAELQLRGQAEQRAQGGQEEVAALRAELRALREAHAGLASEAEAMRARLSETGSRLTELCCAEDREVQARIEALEEDLRRAGQESESVVASWETRLGRVREELAVAIAARDAAAARSAALESERDALSGRLAGLQGELARVEAARCGSAADCDVLRAERDALAARLKEAEAQIAQSVGELSRTQVELLNTRAELEAACAQERDAKRK